MRKSQRRYERGMTAASHARARATSRRGKATARVATTSFSIGKLHLRTPNKLEAARSRLGRTGVWPIDALVDALFLDQACKSECTRHPTLPNPRPNATRPGQSLCAPALNDRPSALDNFPQPGLYPSEARRSPSLPDACEGCRSRGGILQAASGSGELQGTQ